MMLNYQFINNNEQLEKACQQLILSQYIAIDTEFLRIKTYYPHLGLIQLYDGNTVFLVDPLAITNWGCFTHLLSNEQTIKFIHASSEDIEVIFHHFNIIPVSFIDTQILAAFLGNELSAGYANLVEQNTGIQLDKSASRTNWLERPLSSKQLSYAAADVFHLLPLGLTLLEQCEKQGWLFAAKIESTKLIEKRVRSIDPNLAYLDITNAWRLTGIQLACLKLLAKWRIDAARQRDLAVNFVVKEKHLWSIAQQLPTSINELKRLELDSLEIRHHGTKLLELVKQTKKLAVEEYPNKIQRIIDYPNYKQSYKLLKQIVQDVAENNHLNSELLASRKQINQLLKWHWNKTTHQEKLPDLLKDWRRELLYSPLTQVLI